MTATRRKTAGKKVGATKGKLALIAVLAVVFVGVLASNFTSGGVGVAANAAAPTVDAAATAPAVVPVPSGSDGGSSTAAGAVSTAGPFGEFEKDRSWPVLPLEVALEFDPMATPEWALPPKPAEVAAAVDPAESAHLAEAKLAQEEEDRAAAARDAEIAAKHTAELAALRDAANAIILVSGGERVALIGQQEFHVGDQVGGYTISNITPDGIVLGDSP